MNNINIDQSSLHSEVFELREKLIRGEKLKSLDINLGKESKNKAIRMFLDRDYGHLELVDGSNVFWCNWDGTYSILNSKQEVILSESDSDDCVIFRERVMQYAQKVGVKKGSASTISRRELFINEDRLSCYFGEVGSKTFAENLFNEIIGTDLTETDISEVNAQMLDVDKKEHNKMTRASAMNCKSTSDQIIRVMNMEYGF